MLTEQSYGAHTFKLVSSPFFCIEVLLSADFYPCHIQFAFAILCVSVVRSVVHFAPSVSSESSVDWHDNI